MQPPRSPDRNAAVTTMSVAMLSALQWSIRLFQGRAPLQARVRIKPRQLPVIDRQYLAYLKSIDTSHCTNCSYGNGLLACSGETGNATKPLWCPLRASPEKLAGRLPAALVTELIFVEHDYQYQHTQVQGEMPARDAHTRPAGDVMSHLGP